MRMKFFIGAIVATSILPHVGASAASLSSVDCSLNSIVLTFDGNISSGDVTKVEVGETATAKIKYELNLLPGSVSGATLTLSPDAAAKTELRKVSPYKAHIYASGDASGTQKCND